MKKIKPWVWLKYIDDIFFIWLGSEEELNGFLVRLNELSPNLRFPYEKSDKEMDFLDIIVKTENDELVTDSFWKPADRHQYLRHNSCHHNHVKTSVVHSQALHKKTICSVEEDFKGHIEKLKGWFKARE